MKHEKKETTLKEVEEVVAIYLECDVCNKIFQKEPWKETSPKESHAQSFHHLRYVGNYYSVLFEDNQIYECDICEPCLFEKLGPHMRQV